jgi:rhodanese-related sulfurtransferase
LNSGSPASLKGLFFDQFARISKALANPHRLELIDLLAQGERSVEDLAHEARLSVANASQHLQVLRSARLVEVRREGQFAYYRLADDRVFGAWQALRDLAEARLAEVEQIARAYLRDRQRWEPVGPAELLRRLRDPGVVVLDVRPPAEYRAGHIAGARSIPLPALAARLRELPADHEVIAYCRGPYCVLADEAVALLRANGYRARRLGEGLPDWRARGYPVSTADATVVARPAADGAPA